MARGRREVPEIEPVRRRKLKDIFAARRTL
jgi:hypothetical protein